MTVEIFTCLDCERVFTLHEHRYCYPCRASVCTYCRWKHEGV